ncbi:putative oxidoreductase YvaA [Lacunisphaera limnophila]|uniref:Putative oxidoreductase YvaA n=1 Tax=Lacunisphaera limnophila TaxID=1838286 RepID=A0A1D8AZW5_9BACT|nr:Gfo/Idh/MocA family oxidoreductase [Lacunisphaera limnophila]AOS46431.1 putative oxidoreductase YvaA [Lacunisphaera limnophila]
MNVPSFSGYSRRQFLKTGAAASLLPLLGSLTPVFAAGSDRIRVGLVGCGGRGMGAVRNCLAADPSVQLVALGDAFADRVDGAMKEFTQGGKGEGRAPLPADQFAVTRERCFTGFDAYKQVMASGIDLVLLVTPPQFRPLHLQAAVDAGLHVFMEKPVAVDPMGARLVIRVAEIAAQKKLAIVAGTQRRHSADYLETMARIKDGAIGELTGGSCYWMQEGLWHNGRKPEWTEMEYQMRNWLYFTWLSGDHIVEQHMHNIDVMNWAFGGPPVKAYGMGGRQSRTDAKYGDAWDHFAIEFEYANGARVQSMCRQVPGTSTRVSERLTGTKGSADPSGTIRGEQPWKYSGQLVNPYDQEHIDLIRSIRAGTPLNEGKQVAESTLTAILGRMSAYTGREVSYGWLLANSKLDLTPAAYAFGDAPAVKVPVPGETPLV